MTDTIKMSAPAHAAGKRAKAGSALVGGIIAGALQAQRRLSKKCDLLLPRRFRVDGNDDFVHNFARRWVAPGSTVFDVGGGKQPLFSPDEKAQLGLHIVGVDIDNAELAKAPPGAYDETSCVDITHYDGRGDADVVICQALLEHVKNVEDALRSIASILKPGGRAVLFVPSKNAVYARLNLLLPEKFKRRILFAFHPKARAEQGFPAYYDRCTPRDFRHLVASMGLHLEESRLYYMSSYFTVFAPFYLLWRLWMLLFFALDHENSAETFSMAIRKPLSNSAAARHFCLP
jgi:SAM-dependent methyltransferase